MSLESSEKQKSERGVPQTASQQAAAAKTAASAEKVRKVVAKTTAPQQQPVLESKSAKSKSSAGKGPVTKADPKLSQASATSAQVASKTAESKVKTGSAEDAEPVEDKATAKARKKQEKAEAKERAKAEKEERKKAALAERRRVASGGIKDMFILHVEKIVVGVCALAALGIIYASLGTLSLEPQRTPEDLRKQLDAIDQKVTTIPFPANDFAVPVYGDSVSRFKVPVRQQLVLLPTSWNDILVPPHKRGNPEILSPRQLIATAGNGVFLVRNRQPKPAARAAGGGGPAAAAGAAGQPVAAVAVAGGAGRGGAAGAAPMGDAAALIGGGPAAPAIVPEGPPVVVPDELLMELGGVMPPPFDDKNPVFTEGKRWVSLVALLPLSAQMEEYARQFGNAVERTPDDEEPKYAEVRIIRVEVPPGVADSQIDWSSAKPLEWPAQLLQYKADQKSWVMVAPEIVPSKFVRNDTARLPDDWRNFGLGVITKQLGPLLNQPWQLWANHPQLYQAPVVEAPPVEAPKPDVAPADAPADAPVAPVDMNDPFKPAPVAAPVAKPEVKKLVAAPPKVRPVETDQVEYQLIRVFDFSVQPGKQYRYKIQLLLRNPNFNIAAKNLDDPSMALKKGLDSPWSEASNTVAIPFGQSVLADTVVQPAPPVPGPNAARQPAEGNEPVARVVIKILNFDAGQETFATLNLRRGALAAGSALQIVLDPLRRTVGQHNDAALQTDLVLADFQGGEKLEEGLEAPAEMLFIDASGQLVVQNSVQDELWVRAVRRLQDLMTAAAAPPIEGMGQATPAVDLLKESQQENAKKAAKGAKGAAKGPAKAPRDK